LASGIGWHSSGAYLLRTPFNALLTGMAHFTLGFATGFVCLLFYISFPQLFDVSAVVLLSSSGSSHSCQGLYRKISQTILSSRYVKATFYRSKQDPLVEVIHSSSSKVQSTCTRSCCHLVGSVCQKITPVFLFMVWLRVSAGFVMLSWIYLQSPFLWPAPLVPFHSLLHLYYQAFLSAPYLVSRSLCLPVTQATI
jgi:hypothetical protein